MIFGILLSAWGISVALVGVCTNVLFTKRYPGGAYTTDSTHHQNMRQLIIGKVADFLVLFGTAVQLVSLFLKK
jgi:hypothetical protein